MLITLLSLSLSWDFVQLQSTLPSPRSGHSLSYYNNQIYLFGGCDLQVTCFNDLHKFNSTQSLWQKLQPLGDPPLPRQSHSATVVGSKLYIYGGSTLTDYLDDLYVLDFQTLQWTFPNIAGSTQARAYHSSALFDQGLILIFGGQKQNGLTNQLLVLDTINKHWGKPTTVGEIPVPRKSFSFDRHEDKVWVFGGDTQQGVSSDLFYLDFKKKEWNFVENIGGPLKRHGHSSLVFGESIYISAGCNRERNFCYSDLYEFFPQNSTWQKNQIGNLLQPRESHQINYIADTLYLFGGRFLMSKLYGDFLQYNTGILCPNNCSENGTCQQTGCQCEDNYYSSDCSIQTKCKFDCNYRGSCQNFQCSCYPGYYGSYCQGIINCPNNCTSGIQGECLQTGDCQCFQGFYGTDCALVQEWVLCQQECENGNCSDEGDCDCLQGWVGLDCDIQAPIVYSSQSDYQQISLDVQSDVSEIEETEDTEVVVEDQQEEVEVQDSSSQQQVEDYDLEGEDLATFVSADDLSASSQSYETTTQAQDQSALDTTDSLHLIISQMFGLTDSEDPLSYSQNNLRSDPEENETLQWVSDLEDKQDDRQGDIQSCQLFCSYHGVCYEGICYCEAEYTGDSCEIREDNLGVGIKLTDAIIVFVVLFLLGCGVGCYQLRKILKKVKEREETEVQENE